ncbi:beta-mannosidase [Bowmanella pacifica]|uniref:Beta-mannosidase B n=1 Tax=Bowmanella pacifica TaxID=502051 RepID=A0A917YSH9_9ALTE|nr:glycoside hydrolase family 2 protein [Bowmanella pacifica]GGO64799.1 beta-mannosidase [Bowmanella pacifica]
MITNSSMHYGQRLDLCGDWQFRQANAATWLPAQVPGCNFTDLLANGLIDEPFYRDNETKLQWIEQEDWHYQKRFNLSADWWQYQDIQLVAEGLDTFCDLYLNGHKLAESQNMFIGQHFLCKSLLKEGENLLEIRFRSPIKEVLPQYQQAGFAYPAENDKSEDKLSVYCRKAPCHFGWDWGPRFVTSGIWRPIYLQGITACQITDTHFVQHQLDAAQARFSFAISMQSAVAEQAILQVECAQAPQLNKQIPVQLGVGENVQRLDFDLASPQLWWPNGLGDAYLYEFSFTLLIGNQALHSKQQRIGLRTLEVVNEDDAMGQSFFIRVNGQPVFMKGANYIPGDSFVHRMTPERHAQDFKAVVDANMNMLRVWGGGIYQDEVFYQLADEHGILIWQDFMFACTLYPADEAFLANVREEAEYNVKRLRNHPCLALWCGNNEVDMGIKHWQWPEKFGYSDALYARLKDDYIRLFDQCLPEAVAKLDAGRFYLRSSPIGFWEEDMDHMGNHHYWGVWHGEEPFSEYQKRIPRFMSEFGFQSFPLASSMAKFTEQQDWQLDSQVLKVHQKHPRGNGLIRSYMETEYSAPENFARLLFLSQVQQAEGLKLAFEAHRAAQPFCMGTLYWQLNDTWPAASWSGIDYYGRWKALHYQAKRSFRTDLLVIDEVQESIRIRLVSDRLHSINARVDLTLLDFSGNQLWQKEQPISTPANGSAEVAMLPRTELLATHNPNQVVLQAVLIDSQGQELTDSLFYFVPSKQQALSAPNLEVTSLVGEQSLTLTLQSSSLVRQCHVEIDGVAGNFSDNFFDLLPGQSKRIHLALPGTSKAEIEKLVVSTRYQSLFQEQGQ